MKRNGHIYRFPNMTLIVLPNGHEIHKPAATVEAALGIARRMNLHFVSFTTKVERPRGARGVARQRH
jgi:hypothetical protein